MIIYDQTEYLLFFLVSRKEHFQMETTVFEQLEKKKMNKKQQNKRTIIFRSPNNFP